MSPSKPVLRIIDANLNRLGEGLRCLEEIARFVLSDEPMTAELKNLRHRLSPQDLAAKAAYLDARESAGDIGPAIKVSGAEPAKDISRVAVANSRRVQESLRVLEEMAKTPGTGLDSAALQDARFAVYTLEKELVARLLRRDKAARLTGLHAILDIGSLGARAYAGAAQEMLAGGAKVLQLRDKTSSRRQLLDIALALRDLCNQHGALFIVNDTLDIALAAEADGLHLGQDDLPVRVARQLLPLDRLIGYSVRSAAEARQAESDGADYLGFGPVYPTVTKPDAPALGCPLFAGLKSQANLPVIAIGGININNVAEVMGCGADGVAVISALLGTPSVEQATREFIIAMEASHEPAQ